MQTASTHVGAEICSNNTAELSAVVVPLWLLLGILGDRLPHVGLIARTLSIWWRDGAVLSCIASSFNMLARL